MKISYSCYVPSLYFIGFHETPVKVIDFLEVALDLLCLGHFLEHVFPLDAEVENLRYLLRRQVPEVLRSEGEAWEILILNTFVPQEPVSPFNEIDAVHSGHFVVNNYQGHLVFALFIEQRLDRLLDRFSVVVEAGLFLQLELLEKNLLKRNLRKPLVFKYEDLGLHLFDFKLNFFVIQFFEFGFLVLTWLMGDDACDECLVATFGLFVEKVDFASHLLAETLAHVQANPCAVVFCVKLMKRLK